MVNGMKSIVLQFFLISIFLFSLTEFLYPETDKCSKISIDTISKQIPVSDFKIISTRELHGLCEIIINISGRVIPLYGGEDFLISGDLFHEKKNITRDKVSELNKKVFLENKKSLDELVAFEYKPAEIKTDKKIYMFTEPLCPYCHRAGGEIKTMADKYGFVVKILLLSMKGEEGQRKCIEAACRHYIFEDKFNLEQYNQIEWKKEKVEEKFICEKGVELVKKTEELSEKLNIDGIPVFYTNEGDYVSGADMEALEKFFIKK